MNQLILVSLWALSVAFAIGAQANQVGTITQTDGQVKLFTNPGKGMEGPAPHALYEGEYYSVQDAQVGMKIERGNVLRTAPGAKARVVFDNGDQYNVGPATAYKVNWEKAGEAKPEVNLMYGKIRAVISKEGPRTGLQIKTRTATMGVRGTDLYVADRITKGTEVSVLRGEVAVKTASATKSIPVKAGATAEVPAAAPQVERSSASADMAAKAAVPAKPAEVQVRPTTQQDLVVIQRSSDIKKEVTKTGLVDAKAEAEVKKLEAKAVDTTLQDIKKYDPKMYEKIAKEKPASAADLNQSVVATAAKVAPKGADKAGEDELERLDDDAYNKYFKIVD
jgi:hypothetical protein